MLPSQYREKRTAKKVKKSVHCSAAKQVQTDFTFLLLNSCKPFFCKVLKCT